MTTPSTACGTGLGSWGVQVWDCSVAMAKGCLLLCLCVSVAPGTALCVSDCRVRLFGISPSNYVSI